MLTTADLRCSMVENSLRTSSSVSEEVGSSKTMILELIVEERYTGEELEYLINQEEPLEILYNVLDRYIGF